MKKRRLHRRRRLLVVGADGILGKSLYLEWINGNGGEFEVIGTTRRIGQIQNLAFVDLSAKPRSWPNLGTFDVVAYCAGVNGIRLCENHPSLSATINYLAIREVADCYLRDSGSLIMVSSTLVFDGRKSFYQHDSERNPLCQLGMHKALAEDFVKDSNGIVLRTGKILASSRPLVYSWIRDAHKQQLLEVPDNLFVSWVPVKAIGDVMTDLIHHRYSGVVQVSSNEEWSYFQAAKFVLRSLELKGCRVKPFKFKISALIPKSTEKLMHASLMAYHPASGSTATAPSLASQLRSLFAK